LKSSSDLSEYAEVAETFDARKAEIQVAVAGGRPPYAIEAEYGEKGAVKPSSPTTRDHMNDGHTALFKTARPASKAVPQP
jgi:hypothetical protein